MKKLPTVVIYGYSGSGKTSLIVDMITKLADSGYRVCTVKHKPAKVSMDKEGKDTWKHVNAGSALTVFSTDIETDFVLPRELQLEKIVESIGEISDCDLVLAEGFKSAGFPKIAVGDIENRGETVLRYQDNLKEALKAVEQEVNLVAIENKLPGLDCGLCGHESCREMAKEIMAGTKEFNDCQIKSNKPELEVKVDGQDIPLEHFPASIIKNGLKGMLESLKGVDQNLQEITLKAEY